MSNNIVKQISQRKQVKSAIERIDALEQELPRLVMGVNEALSNHAQRTAELASIVEAVVELFGSEVVDAKIKEISDRKVLANLDAAEKNLEKAKGAGEAVKADAIDSKSLIVGREFDKDGNVVFPGKAQLTYEAIKPEFQKKLLGQSAGFQVETPNGGKFEVLEVYKIIEKPAEKLADGPTTPEPAANEG